jgi:hypothetical protein
VRLAEGGIQNLLRVAVQSHRRYKAKAESRPQLFVEVFLECVEIFIGVLSRDLDYGLDNLVF